MITLSLMILLTVIAVGLLTLASISLRASTQGEAMATARSNARLALMLAIGDLQVSLGSDRAVSANSEIISATPAKAHLAGAWESWWDFDPSAGSLSYDQEKTKRFRRWLVSAADPKTTEVREFVSTAWQGDTVELVGDNAMGGQAAASAKVVAGRVPVAREEGKAQGAYAWHVADEASKARINLYRDPSQNTTLAEKRALLAGQRPDPSVMKDTSGNPLACLPTDRTLEDFDEATAISGKIIDLDQVDLLKNALGVIKPFRHDVTPYSLGLLTDVRGGGLKQDLSSVFEMGSGLPAEFAGAKGEKLYASTHGITGISDPYWSTLAGYYNTFRNINSRDTNPAFAQAPTDDDKFSLTNPVMPVTYFPGPVIAKVEVLYTFVARESHSNWKNGLLQQNPELGYMGHLVYSPLVTLHNPYNVSISFDKMKMSIRNVPIGFRFYVNGRAQSTRMVPITDMFVNGGQRGEKSFTINIANWTNPASTTTTGPIVMKPGQTLVCGTYLDPNSVFGGGNGSSFFDYQNNLTGTATAPINAKPGFAGPCVGFDIDWLTPTHDGFAVPNSEQSDNGVAILGLRAADDIYMEYQVMQPSLGLNTAFEVTASLTTMGKTIDYGGLSFQYQDGSTLEGFFGNKLHRYPTAGTMKVNTAIVPNTNPINDHAQAKTVALFSTYARTTNGGVYETGARTPGAGVNTLHDGRLAGKPYLFHNPARTVVRMNLKTEKAGSHSHEMNFQWVKGNADDLFEIDATYRSRALTANTNKGIKSGSYLELPSGPLQTIADFRRSNALTSFYLPNFVQPVANSHASPLISTNKVTQSDPAVASYELLDHSVLANHALYDRFYFSTFATRGNATPAAVFEEFMDGSRPLPSQAFLPYLPPGRSAATAKAGLFTSGKPNDTAYQNAAQYQLVRGAFNVNSTSVQAWKAMLGSLRHNEVTTLWAKNTALENIATTDAPIMAMSLLNGGAIGGAVAANKIDDAKTNEWNGYRQLSDAQLEALAKEIVEQVRARGPFLSFSEFVNRQVGAESEATLSGALETAISRSGINKDAFAGQTTPIELGDLSDNKLYNYKTPASCVGNPAAGAPGWIGQGDLLRILEPAATVRSDTFVVRVCGEAWNPEGKVTARAYAEAVVQRFPDFVDPADPPSVNAHTAGTASRANRVFGRRLSVVSFRWLSSNEI